MQNDEITEQSAEPALLRLRKLLNTAFFDLGTPLGRWTNVTCVALILLTVTLAMIGTLQNVSPTQRLLIHQIELAVSIIFLIEYFLRLWSAHKPLSYAFSFYGFIDLLAWLPLLMIGGDYMLAIRLLRIMRLLRLIRYLKALHLLLVSLSDAIDIVLVVAATMTIIIAIIGNIIHALEPTVFPNAFIGSWWALVTMTTVGYGDVVPATAGGKLLAGVLMITGITIFAMLTGTISVKIAQILNKDSTCLSCHNRIASEFYHCPYCGMEQSLKKGHACFHCKHEISRSAYYCSYCGYRQI